MARVQDLYERSERRDGSACWWFLGGDPDKWPRIWTLDHDRLEKRAMHGPQAVWNIAHGKTDGRRCFMSCCNPRCVNPAHVQREADAGRQEWGKAVVRTKHFKGLRTAQNIANLRHAYAARGLA